MHSLSSHMLTTLCHHMPSFTCLALCLPRSSFFRILSQCVMSSESLERTQKHLDHAKTCVCVRLTNYSTTSSNCSITSSIHTSISSFSSSSSAFSFFASGGVSRLPAHGLASAISSATRNRHAFHSSTDRFLCATSSALTDVSSAASASSNARAYSRRFRRILRFWSLVRSEGGRGRQRNCLKRSRSRFSISCPRKSHIAYPFSIYGCVCV
jgi:hypothetical protein